MQDTDEQKRFCVVIQEASSAQINISGSGSNIDLKSISDPDYSSVENGELTDLTGDDRAEQTQLRSVRTVFADRVIMATGQYGILLNAAACQSAS